MVSSINSREEERKARGGSKIKLKNDRKKLLPMFFLEELHKNQSFNHLRSKALISDPKTLGFDFI